MINNLGKALVLVTAALSLAFLAWAVAIYTQTLDWGWKDPRKELGERVPSEIDKRIAAVKQAAAFRARAEAGVKEGRVNLARAEDDYAGNVLLYRDKLAELRSADGKIDIRGLKYEKGVLGRKDQQRATSPPVFDEKPLPGLEKSTAGYLKELEDLQARLVAITGEIDNLIKKENELTVNLNGQKDEDGKVVKVGLYELLEREKKTQEQIRAESDYLQPLWVEELSQAQHLMERMSQLEKRLKELKQNGQ
jgi:hypothetical protein